MYFKVFPFFCCSQAEFLIEEGCWPEEVDNVCENFGFPLGVLKVRDLSGQKSLLVSTHFIRQIFYRIGYQSEKFL
jgi:3-hydroxyacyl-CoA dehydrogenase